MTRRFARWAVAAGIVAGAGPAADAQPPRPLPRPVPQTIPAPPAQPVAQTRPAEVVTPVTWRKTGTYEVVPQPPAPAAVVPAAVGPPVVSPSAPPAVPELLPVPVPAAGVKPPARVDTRPLPRFPHGYHDPTHAIGPDPSTTSATPPTPPAAADGTDRPAVPLRVGPAAVPTRGPVVPAQPAPAPPQQPIWRTAGQQPVQPGPPAVPLPPQGVPGGSAPNTGGTGTSGNTGGGGQTPAAKWHGHKHPVQPFAPPGAAPVAPTGEGYYTAGQLVEGEPGAKPPRWPYPRSGLFPAPLFETDFSYLDPIPAEQRDWAERLHRVPLGDHFLFSTGGEVRYRYNAESNTRLSGANDTYDLLRNRAYADLWYEDAARVYAEFVYGDTANQDVAPYARDVNRGDVQNLFVDVKAGEVGDNPVYVRGGRQELSYGSQRLVSANDWGNARNRFDGAKAFYRSATLDADAFVVRPTLTRAAQLDTWDTHQTFTGAWLTYKPKKGTFVDAYYLDLDNVNRNVARGRYRSGGFNVSTFGSRYYGRSEDGLLVDVEGMLQVGHWADQSILAQAVHAYLGWHFKDVWAAPTVWAGYDYASGDPDPNDTGQHRTFNQLFQFGHYYYGFVDVTGGQNIRDFNVQAYAYPAKWVTAGLQYHVFRLDSNTDALYNSAGGVLRQDRTGRAGDDVGSELDVLANFHLTDRQDVLLNYCHFFTGNFIRATGAGRAGVPLDYVYAQYSMRW